MITESYYWKQPLLVGADRIERYARRKSISEKQFALLERDIFIGFYSLRKLVEGAGKVSNSTRHMTVEVYRHEKLPNSPTVDWYNRHEFWELYDLERWRTENRDVLWVAHQFVHSFIFSLMGSDVGDGAFFTSDREKEKRLSFLTYAEIVKAFRTFGSDYPQNFFSWRDPKTGIMQWSVDDHEK